MFTHQKIGQWVEVGWCESEAVWEGGSIRDSE